MSEDSSEQTPEIVVYSDYLCPFCYLGKESMEAYLDETGLDARIAWRPFDIQGHKRRPDGTLDSEADDGKDEAYFERARRNVERLSDEYDVEMSLDLPDEIDSWDAQKLALFVEQEYDRSTFSELHDRLFEALWLENRDIGDPEVLVEIAGDAGISEEDVRRAIDSDQLDDALETRFEEGRRRGIRGIPTFIYGDRAMQGAVPPDAFEELLDE